MSAIEVVSHTRDETVKLAAILADHTRSPGCITLKGDLGAGKTTFAQGFIKALAPEVLDVTSPTFTIVQTYPLANGKFLWHVDLYRIKHASELVEIGLEEALEQHICLIEWPEIARDLVPAAALHITFTQEEGDRRRIGFYSHNELWSPFLCNIPR